MSDSAQSLSSLSQSYVSSSQRGSLVSNANADGTLTGIQKQLEIANISSAVGGGITGIGAGIKGVGKVKELKQKAIDRKQSFGKKLGDTNKLKSTPMRDRRDLLKSKAGEGEGAVFKSKKIEEKALKVGKDLRVGGLATAGAGGEVDPVQDVAGAVEEGVGAVADIVGAGAQLYGGIASAVEGDKLEKAVMPIKEDTSVQSYKSAVGSVKLN